MYPFVCVGLYFYYHFFSVLLMCIILNVGLATNAFCVFFKGPGQPLFSTVNLLFFLVVYLICRLEAIVYFSIILDVLG